MAFVGLLFASCGPNGPDLDPISISGTILCYNGAPMEGVNIQVTNDPNGQIETTTDANGYFIIEDLVSDLDYSIKVFYFDGSLLDDQDQEMLKDYITFGATNLDDLQLLMLDFDLSGTNSLQAIYAEVEDLILNTVSTPWRFATSDYEAPSPTNPTGTGQTDNFNVIAPQSDVVIDMIGVKMGDLNGSSCN